MWDQAAATLVEFSLVLQPSFHVLWSGDFIGSTNVQVVIEWAYLLLAERATIIGPLSERDKPAEMMRRKWKFLFALNSDSA